MMVADKRLMTVQEASKAFGVHGETLRRWIRDGTIAGYRQGIRKGYMVDADELAVKLEWQQVEPHQPEQEDNP